jgi:hypothetical protein
MVATMQSCNGYNLETPLKWQVNIIQTQYDQIRFGVDQKTEQKLFCNHVTNYMGFVFQYDTESTNPIVNHCVKTFTLTLNDTKIKIPGICCAQQTGDGRVYYRIPMKQKINFSRIDSAKIQIELSKNNDGKLPPISAIVFTSFQSILAHQRGMIDFKYSS